MRPLRIPLCELLDTSFQSTHPMRGATLMSALTETSRTFQSTHPMRGATVSVSCVPFHHLHFNPRTPCGVRLVASVLVIAPLLFQSTHPMRGATKASSLLFLPCTFQSTHPMRGATRLKERTEDGKNYFNPRTPCGVRPGNGLRIRWLYHFNPRTPCGVRPQTRACC